MTAYERELLERLLESQRQLGIATNALQQFGKSGNWRGNHCRFEWMAHNDAPWKIATQALAQITKPEPDTGQDFFRRVGAVVDDLNGRY